MEHGVWPQKTGKMHPNALKTLPSGAARQGGLCAASTKSVANLKETMEPGVRPIKNWGNAPKCPQTPAERRCAVGGRCAALWNVTLRIFRTPLQRCSPTVQHCSPTRRGANRCCMCVAFQQLLFFLAAQRVPYVSHSLTKQLQVQHLNSHSKFSGSQAGDGGPVRPILMTFPQISNSNFEVLVKRPFR